MSKQKITSVTSPSKVTLNLIKEELQIREKGKIITAKDEIGETRYKRNDALGLMGLLGRFDSKLHTQIREQMYWVSLRDKIHDCLLHEKNTLELSIDEAKFLKDYLNDLPEKDGKNSTPMMEFEIRSRMGISEQLGESS